MNNDNWALYLLFQEEDKLNKHRSKLFDNRDMLADIHWTAVHFSKIHITKDLIPIKRRRLYKTLRRHYGNR